MGKLDGRIDNASTARLASVSCKAGSCGRWGRTGHTDCSKLSLRMKNGSCWMLSFRTVDGSGAASMRITNNRLI